MMKMLRAISLAQSLSRFRTNNSGNIAVIFAIALLPIFTAIGCAVDYSLANAAYAKLQACADSAAVQAVSTEGMTQDAATAQTAAVNWFNALCPPSASNLSSVTVSGISAMVTDNGNGVRTAVVTFKASRQNDFLQAAGLPHTDIKGSATAGSPQPTYIDIYALLDDSSSMGLGATAADQAKLYSLTGCQFGCHQIGSTADNYSVAKSNGVEMRIDVLRQSWINLINQASQAPRGNNFRFATYTFDNTINMLQPLTGSYSTALATADSIDLMAVPVNTGDTYTDNAVQSMAANIPTAGDGTSSANSEKYMIFVTDGVQDAATRNPPDISVISSSYCAALKSKGVKIAVIYTVFLPLPSNAFYQSYVQPIANEIAPALQACASPGLYFAATEASDVSNAFNSIFQAVLASARLTH